MTRVEEIEKEIVRLSAAEFAELRDWMLAEDQAAWDAQIEKDARDGKLDSIFSQALADHAAGKSHVM